MTTVTVIAFVVVIINAIATHIMDIIIDAAIDKSDSNNRNDPVHMFSLTGNICNTERIGSVHSVSTVKRSVSLLQLLFAICKDPTCINITCVLLPATIMGMQLCNDPIVLVMHT